MTTSGASRRTLSKSDFIAARECSAKLYFKEDRFPDTKASNAYLGLLAVGGYMVEALACAQRPDGILLEYGRDFEEDARKTLELLQREDVTIFQGTFLYRRRYARVDIIEKRGNVIKLIEVKAKSFDSQEHLERLAARKGGAFRGARAPHPIDSDWLPKFEDLTFQTIIIQRLFPDAVVKSFLLLVDKSKESPTDDLTTLFEVDSETDAHGNVRARDARFVGSAEQLAQIDLLTEVDLTEDVAQLSAEIDASASYFESRLDADFSVPLAERGSKCAKCEYRLAKGAERNGFAMCWGDLAFATPHALDLYFLSDVKDAMKSPAIESMVTAGKVTLADIPVEQLRKKDGTMGPRGARQLRQIEYTLSGETWIGPGLKAKLEALQYPMHFIDFEASRIALPYHAKMRPYGQVAFQWSDHAVASPGAELQHHEWLNIEKAWPNIEFLRSLRTVIGDTGSVLAWSPFERSTIKGIVEEHARFVAHDPELGAWFDDLRTNRLFDLHKCATDDFYHPGMGGRTSIKVVMDALWKSDPMMRDQFTLWSGMAASESTDPYHALPKLVIAGIEQDVHEGTGAMRAYEAMMYGRERHDAEAKELWCRLLKQYCKLDTLSMVLIYEHWRRCTGLATLPAYPSAHASLGSPSLFTTLS